MLKSNNATVRRIRADLHPDFPRFTPAIGRRARKVKGRFRYIGKLAADRQGDEALTLWNGQ